MSAAIHEVFEVRPRYKANQAQFLFVVNAPEVPIEIIDRLLEITDTELGALLIAPPADNRAAICEEDWLRYKATMLRKVMAAPGDFSFLKYSRRSIAPYWLLNTLYQAVVSIDAWPFLRTLLTSNGPGLLLSHTPTIEQLEKIMASWGIFYKQEEFTAALKTMTYIARNGWSRYLWR